MDSDKFLTIGKMAWTPDDEILVQHVKHSEEQDDWTLILPKVKKSDAGLYECQLTSVAGYHTHVHLNVVGELCLKVLSVITIHTFYNDNIRW